MDIGKSFTYVFEDPEWIKKVLVGGGILFVGILFFWLIGIPLLLAGAVILGYCLTITRNVAEGIADPLPQWSDIGTLFMKGLYGVVGTLIYFAPVLVLACCIGVFSFVGSMDTLGSSGNGRPLAIVAGIVSACLGCLIGLYSFIAGLTLNAPMTRFAMSENQLSVFWDIRGNMDFIKKNLSNYIIATLASIVAGFMGMFGIILCGIGVPFTLFWSFLVSSFLFGQLWRASQGQSVVPAT